MTEHSMRGKSEVGVTQSREGLKRRDLLLSGTIILHRAYLQAGVSAELVVFEALPHAFWNNPALPESREVDKLMAEFLDRHLGK